MKPASALSMPAPRLVLLSGGGGAAPPRARATSWPTIAAREAAIGDLARWLGPRPLRTAARWLLVAAAALLCPLQVTLALALVVVCVQLFVDGAPGAGAERGGDKKSHLRLVDTPRR